MIKYLLSLSILIAVVLVIRGIFRKTVSPRVIYAMWLVVVIRMLLPFALFEIDMKMPQFFTEPNTEITETDETQDAPTIVDTIPIASPSYQVQNPATITPAPSVSAPIRPSDSENEVVRPAETTPPVTEPEEIIEVPEPINYANIALTVWLVGSAIMAVWFIITTSLFNYRLYNDRQLLKIIGRTKVYVSGSTGVPCIAGLIPSVYITPETVGNESQQLILLHEIIHLRHGDHVWAIVRAIALIVFWWNPLVWVAAMLSKRDAELACDDAVSAKFSDEKRLQYARVLIDTIPQNNRYAVGLGSAPIKERILMLVKKQKNRLICLILALILTVSAVVFSFVSLNKKANQEDENQQSDIADASLADVREYALTLAQYFRDPVESAAELRNHPGLWEFLVNSVYELHEKNIVSLTDATEKEWYPQYYIPYDYMCKAAQLFLGINNELPEELLHDDYGWNNDLDAFLYSPFSPPMYETECVYFWTDYDGTIHVTVRISRIEEKEALAINTYTFKTVNDPEFGTQYQLVSITDQNNLLFLNAVKNAEIPLLYQPYTQEVPQDMLAEEISEETITKILQDEMLCDVRILLYLDEHEQFCAAYEKDGNLFRFINAGGAEPADYEAWAFNDILKQDGFAVSWAWAHNFRAYFTVENREPKLYLYAYDSVTEADYDSDGVTEVICQNLTNVHIYDIFDGELQTVSFDSELTRPKPGELYRYLPEENRFEFDYKKENDDTQYHRYGTVKGGVLTLVTPSESDTASEIGKYVSIEAYVEERMAQKKTVSYYSASKFGNSDPNARIDIANVTDTKLVRLEKLGEVTGLTAESVLECWKYRYFLQLDVPSEEVVLVGGQTEEDGYYDLDGHGSRTVMALRFSDGRYAVLTDDPYLSFMFYQNSYEEVIYDWYVKKYSLNLPLYVDEWGDLITSPDDASIGNYPVHRFDGDGWGVYIPVGIWYKSDDTADNRWTWKSSYNTGSALIVESFSFPPEDEYVNIEKQGYTPTDETKRVWESHADGVNSYYYYYENPNGGFWRVTAQWTDEAITDYPHIAIEPQILKLMAERFVVFGMDISNSYSPLRYNFAEIYREAESVYALFTCYRPDIYTEERSVTINGAQYQAVDINGCTTLAGLRLLCQKYFDKDLTDKLMSAKIKDQYPLFVEKSGQLYSYSSYTDPFKYDVDKDYEITLESSDGEKYVACVSAVMEFKNHEIPAEVHCTYRVTDDGVRFSSFELMAEALEALSEAEKNATEYTVEIPLDENDYITCAAAYGKTFTGNAPFGNIISAGYDEIMYYVMGVGNHYWSTGNFKSFRTYRVTSQNGYLESVEETETFTKDVVLRNGKPYTGKLDGMFTCMAHRLVWGNFNYDLLGHTVYLQENGTIDVSSGLIGTGGPMLYEGTYEYDVNTGTFTTKLVGKNSNNGEITYYPEAEVVGKLYEYGGFVHFICEKSGVYSLTVNDPLPLTFVPNYDGSMDAPIVGLDNVFNGEWYCSFEDDDSGNNFYRLVINNETAEIELGYGHTDGDYTNRYVGSYTINPLTRAVTASLRKADVQNGNSVITMKFNIGYASDDSGTSLFLDVLSCDQPKFQYLVGKSLVFKYRISFSSLMKGDTRASQYIAAITSDVLNDYRNGKNPNEGLPASETKFTPYPLETIRSNPDANEISEILKKTLLESNGSLKFKLGLGDGWVMELPIKIGYFGESREAYFTGIYIYQEQEPIDTITDIADWDMLFRTSTPPQDDNYKHAPGVYSFFYNLVGGKSEIPEYNELGINDYSITRLEGNGVGETFSFTFTVTGNSLPETLPPGTHTKIVNEVIDVILYDNITDYEKQTSLPRMGLDRFGDYAAVQAVDKYLWYTPFVTDNWNVPEYGKWDSDKSIIPYNYICAFYGGENMEVVFSDMQRLLSEKFGITIDKPKESCRLNRCWYDKETDTVHYADTRGLDAIHRFIDVTESDGITYVTVQFYADRQYLIPASKIVYKIGEDNVFLGSEVVETGKYEPFELR